MAKTRNNLFKLISFVLAIAFIIGSFVLLSTNSNVADATTIRPSATNSAKVPEIVVEESAKDDPDGPFRVKDKEEEIVKKFTVVNLYSYFDATQETFEKEDVKEQMVNSWISMQNKPVSSLNANLTDELAKQVGKNSNYTKENFEITYFFDLTIDEDSLTKLYADPLNHIDIIFKLIEIEPTDIPPVVLYRCEDSTEWKMIPLTDVKNNGDYTITVRFYELCSVLFVDTKDVATPPEQDQKVGNITEWDFPWWILIIIAAILIAIIILIIYLKKKRDKARKIAEEAAKEKAREEALTQNLIPDDEPNKVETPEENSEDSQDDIQQEEAENDNSEVGEDASQKKNNDGSIDQSGQTSEEIEESNEEIPETQEENEQDELDFSDEEELEEITDDLEDSSETSEDIDELNNIEDFEDATEIDETEELEDINEEIEEETPEENIEEPALNDIPEEPAPKLNKLGDAVDSLINLNPPKESMMKCTLAVASLYQKCDNSEDKKTVVKSVYKMLNSIKK